MFGAAQTDILSFPLRSDILEENTLLESKEIIPLQLSLIRLIIPRGI